MESYAVIYKNLGETPLEALERFRANHEELAEVPMTYAGRLDPLAEGQLIILIGDECRKKELYLNLDKEYEVEILFGISTDTYDALGLASKGEFVTDFEKRAGQAFTELTPTDKKIVTFAQTYPPYSSKTIKGIPLHQLARTNSLPDEMPEKFVKIYELEFLDRKVISAGDLLERILNNIDRVAGDFRQEEIKKRWLDVLDDNKVAFNMVKIRVKCSSGTYMRSLAHKVGQDAGTGAFALSIKRTQIFL